MANGSAGRSQSEPSRARPHGVGADGWVRRAEPSDLDALLALEAGFPGDRLSRRQLRRHLASPRADLGVLLDGQDRVVGYALVLSHARRGDARLYSIVVEPGLRGRGAGRRLLAWSAAQASRRGTSGLRLEVRADNAAALALYASEGFRPCGRKTLYYEDGADAVCLRRDAVELLSG